MTLARRHAWISVFLWSLILIGLVAVLAVAGPERFSAPEYATYRLVVAAILLPGYLISMWILWRQRRGRDSGELDERDERVARRASEFTMIAVALVVYASCIALWETYKYSPVVPAGWFYVLAYLTVAVLSLVHAAARLICDASGAVDG